MTNLFVYRIFIYLGSVIPNKYNFLRDETYNKYGTLKGILLYKKHVFINLFNFVVVKNPNLDFLKCTLGWNAKCKLKKIWLRF